MNREYKYDEIEDNKVGKSINVQFPSFEVNTDIWINKDYANDYRVQEKAEQRLILEFMVILYRKYIDWGDTPEDEIHQIINDSIFLYKDVGAMKEALSCIYPDKYSQNTPE